MELSNAGAPVKRMARLEASSGQLLGLYVRKHIRLPPVSVPVSMFNNALATRRTWPGAADPWVYPKSTARSFTASVAAWISWLSQRALF